jgi:hypothetical protein
MAKFLGRRVPAGVALEATRGVGVAPAYVLGKTNYSLDDKANKARSGEGFGSISGEGTTSIVVGKFSEGEIEFELGCKVLPVILSAVFGGASVPTAAGSGYKHTLALAENNQHKTLSITLDDPNGDVMFKGCMVDTFEVVVGVEEIVKATLGLKGKASVDSVYSSSLACDYKWVGRDLEFKVAATTAGLAAASAVSLKELTLTVNKNTDYNWVLGTIEPEDINNKQITIQGALTLNYEDRVWRDYMLNGDFKAVSIKLYQTRNAVGDQYPTFYLELPKVDFSEWESQRDNDEIVTQTINFTALYDCTSGKLISDCYVINNVASY